MKKVRLYIILFILLFILTTNVSAGASLSVSKSSVYVGNTFTTSVNLSGVAAWEVHVSSNGPVKNCSINAADSSSDAKNTSKRYSVTCTATNTGTIKITFKGNTTTESGSYTPYNGITKTVTVTKKPTTTQTTTNKTNTTNKKASSVNSLKSLEVEGGTLSPKFDSGNTSYEVTMPAKTEKISIKAEVEDDKSKLSGIGEKEVSSGLNSFDIIVTAENGAKKTYTIKVNVEEESIVLRLNNEQYTVIRHEKSLPQVSSYYSNKIIKYKYVDIEDNTEKETEIPAYYSEITKYTLIGLKDNEGNSGLYIFDNNKRTYIKYTEINFGNIVFYPMDVKEELLDSIIKTKTNIGDKEYECYQFDKNSDYYLVYGQNVNTGNIGWFMYDSKENTLQRYNLNDIKDLMEQNNKYMLVVMLLSSVCFIMMLFLLLLINKVTKKEK